MLNAFNLEELVQYYLDLKSKSNYPDNITIVPTVLEGPQWYDITNINSWTRRKIDTQLQTYKGKDESLDSWLESVHKCLSNSEHEGHNLNINTVNSINADRYNLNGTNSYFRHDCDITPEQCAENVELDFDDGHNTGIYSWDYLFELCKNKDILWKNYLERLLQNNQER